MRKLVRELEAGDRMTENDFLVWFCVLLWFFVFLLVLVQLFAFGGR